MRWVVQLSASLSRSVWMNLRWTLTLIANKWEIYRWLSNQSNYLLLWLSDCEVKFVAWGFPDDVTQKLLRNYRVNRFHICPHCSVWIDPWNIFIFSLDWDVSFLIASGSGRFCSITKYSIKRRRLFDKTRRSGSYFSVKIIFGFLISSKMPPALLFWKKYIEDTE